MLWQSLTWFKLPEGFALNIREWYRMITNDVALETPLSLVRLKVFLNLGTNADGKICHSLATPCANMMVNSERTSSIDYCNYSHLHLWHFMCLFMLFIYTYIYISIYDYLCSYDTCLFCPYPPIPKFDPATPAPRSDSLLAWWVIWRQSPENIVKTRRGGFFSASNVGTSKGYPF
jgi:hypothetical protein